MRYLAESSTRYIGWCPVCERDIKVRGGLLVHHGYQRPGIGHIVGDCPGVDHSPYETGTATCVFYLQRYAEPRIASYSEQLHVLKSPSGPLKLRFDDYDPETRRVRRHSGGAPKTIELTRQEADALAAQLPSWDAYRYSWEKRLLGAIQQVTAELEFWQREQNRMQRLIAEWAPQPLRTIEEEIKRQEQSKAERETARTVARDQKITNEVLKLRKRIDSAVKNKNSAVLSDIYASNKIREISGWRLSQADALALLERDDVWRAFGLLTPSGYRTEEEAKITLSDMRYGLSVPRADRGYDTLPLPWPAELGGGTAKTRGF